MGGLIAAVAALTIALIALMALHLLQRRRIRKLAGQMEAFLVSGSEPLGFSVKEDAMAPLQNAAAELENQVLLARDQKKEERRATRDLTADISHQLKTPLASLRLFCEMDESAHVNEQLSQIERMERLIQSLLRLERLCADGYEFSYAMQDMASLVRDSWRGLASVYPCKKLKIEGNAVVRCDAKWMGEACLNLFKNACEHTPEDGEIAVHMEKSDTAFFISFSDNGGGVDEKELAHLFDRFYRAHSREAKGAGIGLSIVKEIIRRHHGSIYAENIPGGLRVNITLPILHMIRT
ncbi:MAG: HAMP domain-containing histidine kinase [Clostridia bacterium]|nr:HAMP domain-containing histidine kinase [Clostridia bacterium]